MEISEILNYVTNNGVAIVLMFYFLKNNNKSLLELKESNKELSESILKLINNCSNKKD